MNAFWESIIVGLTNSAQTPLARSSATQWKRAQLVLSRMLLAAALVSPVSMLK